MPMTTRSMTRANTVPTTTNSTPPTEQQKPRRDTIKALRTDLIKSNKTLDALIQQQKWQNRMVTYCGIGALLVTGALAGLTFWTLSSSGDREQVNTMESSLNSLNGTVTHLFELVANQTNAAEHLSNIAGIMFNALQPDQG